MKTEFEIKFAKINREQMREKLKNIWAKCIMQNTLMKRVVFENPLNKTSSYVRVRDEWGKITTTFKDINQDILDINSVKEIEVEVSDFESMKNIYTSLWIRQKSYQETYRETWGIDDKVYFMLDEWPWISPFIEIEAENEDIVREYVIKLWFNYDNWFFWAVDELCFDEVWIPREILNNLEFITFENPPKV